MNNISLKDAKYLDGYKMEILFNDNESRVIDLSRFLETPSYPRYNKYKEEQYFKKFKIENENLVWGKNWIVVFPVYELYSGVRESVV